MSVGTVEWPLNIILDSYLWVWVVGIFLTIRYALVVLAAEQGRKKDLVKRLYKANTDFQIAVLIPLLDTQSLRQFQELLTALENQTYPTSRVSVQAVTTPEIAKELDAEAFPPIVTLWTYPLPQAIEGESIGWLIERCLAAGGMDLFVFLKPTDIVKPDFCQNLVVQSFEHSVMQSFVADRTPLGTPLKRVTALGNRLMNRINNAGRFHMGFGARLLDTGWIVKRDVLEKIPYTRSLDKNNLEYTLKLRLNHFPIVWAPNVVVFQNESVLWSPLLIKRVGTVFNRFRLLFRYGVRLLTKAVVDRDVSLLDLWVTMVTFPAFLTGLVLLIAGVVNLAQGEASWGTTWLFFASVTWGLQMLAMFVARCPLRDYETALIWTPWVYLQGAVIFPWAMVEYGLYHLSVYQEKQQALNQKRKTRFNEAMESPPDLFNEPDEGRFQAMLNDVIQEVENQFPQKKSEPTAQEAIPSLPKPAYQHVTTIHPPQSQLRSPGKGYFPRVVEKSVSVTNGVRNIQCILQTTTSLEEVDGTERYQMALIYKGASFSTRTYRILDQAFYELHTKLQRRGLMLNTCGSCGYFHNPTADVPESIKNKGVCLFGKYGKEVNVTADGITVVTPACAHHCDIDYREGIAKEWQDSLQYAPH